MEDAAVCLFCVCAGAFGGSALNTLAEYQLLCHTVLCCAVLCVQVYRGKWCSIDIAAKEYLAVEDGETDFSASGEPTEAGRQKAQVCLRALRVACV